MISLVIPCYNEEKYLRKTIEAALEAVQKVNGELIIVDNASTDESRHIVESFCPEVRYVYEGKKGLLHARQAGLNAANFKFVAYIDADTRIKPDYLYWILCGFMRDNVVGVSNPYGFWDGSLGLKIGCELFFLWWRFYDGIVKMFGGPRFLYGPSFAVRKSAMEKIGGFNTGILFYGEDSDTTRRISKVGETRFLWSNRVLTSARRYKNIGIFKTLKMYLINYISVMSGKGDVQ